MYPVTAEHTGVLWLFNILLQYKWCIIITDYSVFLKVLEIMSIIFVNNLGRISEHIIKDTTKVPFLVKLQCFICILRLG